MTRRNCRKKSWCWQSGDRERWMRLLFRQPRRERSRASDAGAQSFSRLLREAGSFHSRQAASRLLAQHSQWLRAFGPRSVRKLPGGKIFDSDLLADIVNDALAFRTALDVIYVLESEAEHSSRFSLNLDMRLNSYTTTFSTPGNTSRLWQCNASTSPSIMASTGASR